MQNYQSEIGNTRYKNNKYVNSEDKNCENRNSKDKDCKYRKTDFHTHSRASGHGTEDSITDMAREAARRSMETLGISDHGPASPGSAGLSYFRSLILCERSRFGVRLCYGAEANILDKDGSLDIPDEVLKSLDYCIISMHRPIYTPGSEAENTRAYIRAMRHPGVKIIGHCDDSRFPVNYRELAEAALAADVIPEINNVSLLPGSYRKNCRENTLRLLNACQLLSCPVLLSSDSHGCEHIGEVTEALRLLQEAGFPRQLLLN